MLEILQSKATLNKSGYARILDILTCLFSQVPKRARGSQHPFVSKVLKLGDNFPLWYYADGSKYLPDEIFNPESALAPIVLTLGRRRVEQKRHIFQAKYDLRSRKVERLHADLAIEVVTAVQFQLEQQLLNEEAKLSYLSDELDQIEQTLLEAD